MVRTSLKKPPDFVYSFGMMAGGVSESWMEMRYHPPEWPDPPVDCNSSVWMIPGTYNAFAR